MSNDTITYVIAGSAAGISVIAWAALVLVPYGLTYFLVVRLLKVPEANAVINRGPPLRAGSVCPRTRSVTSPQPLPSATAIAIGDP